ncbi:hypothetical protein DFJ58DRAFT_721227 [Suillus subalutaceus]|uniref:uncharacterized protein n=1 Tax=Suillus subalutaceus TaxID=48586 RepID=UPI001B8846BF|nr:uncharacterized protein DFJ58DRAFT_721227 [Suillus subalutaceus]KAG1875395.1 hypothetical protein DFJ58DRAFT_721227 [Suillus subalutaceus]
MNIGPGGKQKPLSDTIIPLSNPPPKPGCLDTHRVPQSLVYPSSHPNKTFAGKLKGMRAVLEESVSVWDEYIERLQRQSVVGKSAEAMGQEDTLMNHDLAEAKVISDDDAPVTVTVQAKCTIIPSSHLTASNNSATPELSSHKNMQQTLQPNWTPSLTEDLVELSSEGDEAMGHKGKHLHWAHDPSFFTADAHSSACLIDDTEETSSTRNATPAAMDNFLSNIDVQDTLMTPVLRCEERSCDVSAFFGKPYVHKAKDGKTRSVQDCESCKKKGYPCQIVSDTPTCQCHIAFQHSNNYHQWCKTNNFESMLPQDIKECKTAVAISQVVSGTVNLMCDAWQASNANGYFATTDHWIEETSPGVWQLECAVLGFTQLNNSHNGQCLGQALFKIVD